MRTAALADLDGPDAWTYREKGVAALIAKWKPVQSDRVQPLLIGVQEATPTQMNFLAQQSGMNVFGTCRMGQNKDEALPVLSGKNSVLLEGGYRWLSQTPSVPGSMSWDAKCPRLVTYTVFSLEEKVGLAIMMNTHLDHVGVQARKESLRIIKDTADELQARFPSAPLFLTGDFNCTKVGSEANWQTLTEAKFYDGFREATTQKDNGCRRSTFHKFKGLKFESDRGDGTVDLSSAGAFPGSLHLDWVMYRPSQDRTITPRPTLAEVITATIAPDRYPSDHFPVSVDFDLINRPVK